jgi:hypothetical protein
VRDDASALRALRVAGQVAVSLVLLAVAGVFRQSLAPARAADPGFAYENTAYVQVGLWPLGAHPTIASTFEGAGVTGGAHNMFGRVNVTDIDDYVLVAACEGEEMVAGRCGRRTLGRHHQHPTFVTSFPLKTGSMHAVFPYYQESTGRFLLIVGDERVQRRGLAWEGTGPDHRQQYDPETGTGGYPRATSGYTQIVDFTDPMNPV